MSRSLTTPASTHKGRAQVYVDIPAPNITLEDSDRKEHSPLRPSKTNATTDMAIQKTPKVVSNKRKLQEDGEPTPQDTAPKPKKSKTSVDVAKKNDMKKKEANKKSATKTKGHSESSDTVACHQCRLQRHPSGNSQTFHAFLLY